MGWWDPDGVEPKIPHAFSVADNAPQETGLLRPNGKPILRNPPAIGYMKPSGHPRYVVKA